MPGKVLPAFFIFVSAATILTMLYLLPSRDALVPVLPYRPPIPQPTLRASPCLEAVAYPWDKDIPYGVPVLLTNASNTAIMGRNTTKIVDRLYNKMCPDMPALKNSQFVFDNILLIVDFVEAKYYNSSIPYVELLYRRSFPKILYCGQQPDVMKQAVVSGNLDFPVYYVHALKDTWQVKYECIERAMKTCDNFTGYLLIGDDTLINMKMFQATPKDKVVVGDRFLRKGNGMNTTQFHNNWWWWEREGGRSSLLGILNELSFRALHEKDGTAEDFLQKYYSFVNTSTVFHNMAVDFLYVPKRLSSTYLYMTSLFRKYKANVELAVPFLACGLIGDVHFVKMKSLWGSDRGHPQRFFLNDTVYVHPFKQGTNFRKPDGSAFICQRYLPSV